MPKLFAAASPELQGLILELVDALTDRVEGYGFGFNENRAILGQVLRDKGYRYGAEPVADTVTTAEPSVDDGWSLPPTDMTMVIAEPASEPTPEPEPTPAPTEAPTETSLPAEGS